MYLNDILVYLKIRKDYVQYVRKMLKALQDINLKMKSEKSYFYIKEVSFLDFIILTEELKMNSEKIQSVKK